MLDEGACGTIDELARREGVNRGYMRLVLRLTLLAPEIVDSILDGTQGTEISMARLLEPFSVEWANQQTD